MSSPVQSCSHNTIIINQLNIHVNTFEKKLRIHISLIVNHCGSECLDLVYCLEETTTGLVRYSHNTADSADAEAVAMMEEALVTWNDSEGMLVMQSA